MKSTIAKKTEGYGYKYTELADINKYCETNGIEYWQEVETCETNGKDYIVTYIWDTHIENCDVQKRRGCQIVEAVLQGIKNPVQEYGSSLTYCRRYSLLMALGLATEDDDAASLTVKKEATKEDAEKWSFNFGKYKGKTMNEVIQEDTNYMKWYLDNKANEYDVKCYELLTGEKLPTEEESQQRIKLMAELNNLVEETECDYDGMLKHYGVESNNQMTIAQLQEAINTLKSRLNKQELRR